MTSVCILDQTLYEFDARVKRKAEALVAAGYAVDVLALRRPGGKKMFTLNGVTVYTLPLEKKRASLFRYLFEYAAFFLWALVKVPLLMRRRKYAVVDVNTLPDFLIFAPAIARWMGAKLILDMHEITPEFYMSKYGIASGSWLVRLMQFQERISMAFADHVITITEPIQDLLVSRGLPRSKSTIIMNAADEARFQPDPAAPATPGDLGTFAMMYHGTLTRTYGLDIAIEAFSQAHAEMPAAELWILGFGPDEDSLKALVQRRGLAAKVRMLGPVPSTEVPGWLRRCDAGILPMRRDVFLDFAFPNKLSEFIISGKAVLVSRLKTIRTYFSQEALAYFEPNDTADLARQMVRLYRDRGLRARLAARARQEYAPIRWDVMKERYLRLVESVADRGVAATGEPRVARLRATGLQRALRRGLAGACRRSEARDKRRRGDPESRVPDTRESVDRVRAVAMKLLAYCRKNDWAGYDPYDALNSRLFSALPFLNARVPRLCLTQALKRSPVNVRRLALIPKTQNPKAMALFLAALLRMGRSGHAGQDDLVRVMIDRLTALRSRDDRYSCWGYSFPWQTRTIVVPRWAPNLVCTSFVANALLDAYEQQGDPRCLVMAASAAKYIRRELYWTDGPAAAFSYPIRASRVRIHNANFLGAALLCRVHTHTGDRQLLGPALNVARYSVSRQHADGSWDYGEEATQRWIDNFHTGYNLCALHSIGRSLETAEFEPAVRRGLAFYRSHFFREDGAPRYFHDRTYPIDIHCVAQSIITLVTLKDLDPGNVHLAQALCRWAIDNMWDDRGFFYYRVLRLGTIRTSYMRWSQAWMLLALATSMSVDAAAASHHELARVPA
jgi:glycosyltransferase involved in cell wall biosynthesis